MRSKILANAFAPWLLAALSIGCGGGCSSSEPDAVATPPTDASSDDATSDTSGDTATDAALEAADASDAAPSDTGEADSRPADAAPSPLIVARPYESHTPTHYDASKPTPLVVLLHGYSASGAIQNSYFGTSALSDAKGFLLAYPDGTPDSSGNRYWNATDACCAFAAAAPDDVAYLDAVIDDMSARYNVDPKRVYLVGHSNGGFMSHRYACDRSHRIAAIAELAGAQWNDVTKCKPSEPVAVMHLHGDLDSVIAYAGGANGGIKYPSANQTVADWAGFDGCATTPVDTGATYDLITDVAGEETKVARYEGCKPGGAAELWTIKGGSHVPTIHQPAWGEAIWTFLAAHPKP